VTHLVHEYGLLFLFLIVAVESSGVWVPGETALIAASVLASNGFFSIVDVILIAAGAAILGDNVGYAIGRVGGRRLLSRFGRFHRILDAGERFFRRHGGKAVFLARFVAGVRVTGAWMAGIARMEWWRFLVWNAAGGIVWAVAVGLVAYYFGRAAADAIGRFGLIGGAAVVVLALLAVGAIHIWRRRMVEST